MTDIVERLRNWQDKAKGLLIDDCLEAIAEIERLRERCEAYKGQIGAGADEIERLRTDIADLLAAVDRLRAELAAKEPVNPFQDQRS